MSADCLLSPDGLLPLLTQGPRGVVLLFVLGSVLGSFALCAGSRLANGQSLLTPPSSCDVCGTRIRARHLVPLVGWLVLKGRCAHCHAPISPVLPAAELAGGILAGLLALRFGVGPSTPVLLAAFTVLAVLGVVDVRTGRLPDRLLLPLAALLPPALALSGNAGLSATLPWGCAASAFLLGFRRVAGSRTGTLAGPDTGPDAGTEAGANAGTGTGAETGSGADPSADPGAVPAPERTRGALPLKQITRREVLGLGDVKLAFVVGCLALEATPAALALASLSALVHARLRSTRDEGRRDGRVAFGPHLILGAAAGLLLPR